MKTEAACIRKDIEYGEAFPDIGRDNPSVSPLVEVESRFLALSETDHKPDILLRNGYLLRNVPIKNTFPRFQAFFSLDR